LSAVQAKEKIFGLVTGKQVCHPCVSWKS
jgi:hypothetical protein